MTTFRGSLYRATAAGLLGAPISIAATIAAHAAAAPTVKRTAPVTGPTTSLADDGEGGGSLTGTTTPTYRERGILSRSDETIQPLGPNLMGDHINELSGAQQPARDRGPCDARPLAGRFHQGRRKPVLGRRAGEAHLPRGALAEMVHVTAASALAGVYAKLNSIALPMRPRLTYDRDDELSRPKDQTARN